MLKNQTVVSELEKAFSSFKPVEYDLSAQLKAIDAFEKKAVDSAEQTAAKVGEELKKLEATLGDIEGARSFDQLTVRSRCLSPSLRPGRLRTSPRRSPRSTRRSSSSSRRAAGTCRFVGGPFRLGLTLDPGLHREVPEAGGHLDLQAVYAVRGSALGFSAVWGDE